MDDPSDIKSAITEVISDVTETQKNEEKKKVGRPRKNPTVVPIEIHGIAAEPRKPEHVLEMTYAKPANLKKIFNLYKAYTVSEINMCFDQNGLRMSAIDHNKISNIHTIIDGRCMSHYYCKNIIKTRVKRENLCKIFGIITQNQPRITFIMDERSYRSEMLIIIKDKEYDTDKIFKVELINDDKNDNPVTPDDTNYPIRFKISSAHFRTEITNIKKFSPYFNIEKHGKDDLMITYDNNCDINYQCPYSDKSIELLSTISENESFSVKLSIDYIKPFSSTTLGDDIYIAADKMKSISFMTQMDKCDPGYAATVRVFTEVYKPKEAKNAGGANKNAK